VERDITAYRTDIKMAIPDVHETDRTAESVHVKVGIADIAHFHRCSFRLQDQITTQSLRVNGPAGGAHADE
jgi:hypothetical protein